MDLPRKSDYANVAEWRRAYNKAWRAAHPFYKRDYYAKNREKLLEESRKERQKPGYKERHCKYNIEWARRHRAKANAKIRAYKHRKSKACPSWANLEEIAMFYELAKRMEYMFGKKFHVDHIWPLRGKTFSGLHVPWNLQILPASKNCSKGNRPPSIEEWKKQKSHSLITN